MLLGLGCISKVVVFEVLLVVGERMKKISLLLSYLGFWVCRIWAELGLGRLNQVKSV